MSSRTRNSMLNTVFGIGSHLFILLFTFFSRKIFIDVLGPTYLGLNTTFSNIVLMLSLTELGLGSSMVYFLYKPLAENDHKMVRIYQAFFRNIYNYIGIAITAIGFVLSFGLLFFVKSDLPTQEVQFFFILYLLATTVTYFLSYKKNLLLADQQNRVISVAHTIAKIAFEIAQITIILVTQSYVLYLLLFIVFNFTENLLISFYVDRKYPHLKQKEIEKLSSEQKKEVMIKVRDLFVQNISGFVVSSTDTLLISAFIDVAAVGLYGNYLVIINVLKTMFSQIFSSFTTSFGNLHASADVERCYGIYRKGQFLAFWFLSFTSIAFFILIQDFIFLWLYDGAVLATAIPFLIVLSYYVYGISVPSISIQNALGLYNADRNLMIVQAVINFILSIIFVNTIGVAGVILGTVLSTACIPMISKPYIIHNQVFGRSPKRYYKELFYGLLLTIIVGAGVYYLSSMISTGILFVDLIGKAIFTTASVNVLYVCIFYQTEEFQYYFTIVKNMLSKVLKKGSV